MPQPIWRKIVSELKVPEDPNKQWTMALEYVTPGKIMKIEVIVDPGRNPPVTGDWTPVNFSKACSADGDLKGDARGAAPVFGNPLVASSAVGSLIARLGGSTADMGPDTASATPTTTPATPSRIVFCVGRTCVFIAPTAPVGSLFLGINDDATRMIGFAGCQLVNIYEAL